jgi:hypothetical protein
MLRHLNQISAFLLIVRRVHFPPTTKILNQRSSLMPGLNLKYYYLAEVQGSNSHLYIHCNVLKY